MPYTMIHKTHEKQLANQQEGFALSSFCFINHCKSVIYKNMGGVKLPFSHFPHYNHPSQHHSVKTTAPRQRTWCAQTHIWRLRQHTEKMDERFAIRTKSSCKDHASPLRRALHKVTFCLAPTLSSSQRKHRAVAVGVGLFNTYSST